MSSVSSSRLFDKNYWLRAWSFGIFTRKLTCHSLVNVDEIVMTKRQKELYDQMKEFVLERKDVLHFPSTLNSSERSFVKRIAAAIEIRYGTETSPEGVKNLYIEFDEEEDDEDVESQEARARVMRKYDQAEVVEDVIENEKLRNEKAKNVYEDRLQQWKKDYYLVCIFLPSRFSIHCLWLFGIVD